MRRFLGCGITSDFLLIISSEVKLLHYSRLVEKCHGGTEVNCTKLKKPATVLLCCHKIFWWSQENCSYVDIDMDVR